MQQLILNRILRAMDQAGWAPDVRVCMDRDVVIIEHDGRVYGRRDIFEFCAPDIDVAIGAWLQAIEHVMGAYSRPYNGPNLP